MVYLPGFALFELQALVTSVFWGVCLNITWRISPCDCPASWQSPTIIFVHKNTCCICVKCPLWLFNFNWNLNVLPKVSKISWVPHFLKIYAAVLKFLHVDRHGKTNRYIFATWVTIAPKNYLLFELDSPLRHFCDTAAKMGI